MRKDKQPVMILFILSVFVIIVFAKILQIPTTPTTTTVPTTTSTTIPTTTTTSITTTSTTTTIPAANCTGTNIRVCVYGSKFDCLQSKCCGWNQTISKCGPKECSQIGKDFCANCGCIP